MQDANLKGYRLCCQPLEPEEHDILSQLDGGIVHCLPVDQYSNSIYYPFVVPIFRAMPLENVREAIMNKLMQFDIKYNYGKDRGGKEIYRPLTEEQLAAVTINYAEFKTSRRNIDYSHVTVREFAKHETLVDFPKGQNFVNIGLEFNVEYQRDENQRGNGQLKINAA